MDSNKLEISYSNGIEKNIIIEMCTDALGQEFLIIYYSNLEGNYSRGFEIDEKYEVSDFAFDITNGLQKNLINKDMLFKNYITGIVSNEPIYPSIYLGTKSASGKDFNVSLANTIKLIESLGLPYFLAKDGQISSKRNERVEDYIREADELYFAQEKLNKS